MPKVSRKVFDVPGDRRSALSRFVTRRNGQPFFQTLQKLLVRRCARARFKGAPARPHLEIRTYMCDMRW
jgi:hypothetical protein